MKMKLIALLGCLLLSTSVYATTNSNNNIISKSVEGSTMIVYGGVAVSNSISDEKSKAWGVEQEIVTDSGYHWQFGYMNEGHKISGDKRDGIYSMIKLPYHLESGLITSFSVGPYLTATTVSDQTFSSVTTTGPGGTTTVTTESNVGKYHDSYGLVVLAAADITYDFNREIGVGFDWRHVMFTKGSKDADVFLIGVRYTFN